MAATVSSGLARAATTIRQHRSLAVFLVGTAVVVVLFQTPAGRALFTAVAEMGYWGTYFAGILYGSALTSSAATVIFAGLPDHLPLILTSIIGALGSATYDLIVFAVIRSNTRQGPFTRWRERFNANRGSRVLFTIIGIFILASPLPDELAIGLLGISTIRPIPFLALSFGANALGILCIRLLG